MIYIYIYYNIYININNLIFYKLQLNKYIFLKNNKSYINIYSFYFLQLYNLHKLNYNINEYINEYIIL